MKIRTFSAVIATPAGEREVTVSEGAVGAQKGLMVSFFAADMAEATAALERLEGVAVAAQTRVEEAKPRPPAKAKTKPVEAAAKPDPKPESKPEVKSANGAHSNGQDAAAGGAAAVEAAVAPGFASAPAEEPREDGVDVAELAKAERLYEVVHYLQARGYHTAEAITAACERLYDEVPLLGRIGRGEPLATRVTRTLETLSR